MSLTERLAELRHQPTPHRADPILRRAQQTYEIARWIRSGREGAAPHLVKQRLIRRMARKFDTRVLVETGTYLGDMCIAMRRGFAAIYSIELDQALHRRAELLLAGQPHVTLLRGDSAATLPAVLERIDSPALFWLDGHYSGGVTARGSVDYPVIDELCHIGTHRINDHVVLIDDARLFTGGGGTPSLGSVLDAARGALPGHVVEIRRDVIAVFPARDAPITPDDDLLPDAAV